MKAKKVYEMIDPYTEENDAISGSDLGIAITPEEKRIENVKSFIDYMIAKDKDISFDEHYEISSNTLYLPDGFYIYEGNLDKILFNIDSDNTGFYLNFSNLDNFKGFDCDFIKTYNEEKESKRKYTTDAGITCYSLPELTLLPKKIISNNITLGMLPKLKELNCDLDVDISLSMQYLVITDLSYLKSIKVKKDLILDQLEVLEKLPDSIYTGGNLKLFYAARLKKLPDDLYVGKDLDIRITNISSINSGTIKGDILLPFQIRDQIENGNMPISKNVIIKGERK